MPEGRFPNNVGHLFSPGGQRGPFEFMPYALDNARFTKRDNWSEDAWQAAAKLLERRND